MRVASLGTRAELRNTDGVDLVVVYFLLEENEWRHARPKGKGQDGPMSGDL